MEFNIEDLKSICEYLEKYVEIDEDGDFIELDLNLELPNRHELPEVTDKLLLFYVNHLESADCIETVKYLGDSRPTISSITSTGYKFFSAIKEPAIINKLKESMISSIPALITTAIKYATQIK